MASIETVEKIKVTLRISHQYLDDDISDTVDACVKDLKNCGIEKLEETDPSILNLIKLWCLCAYDDNMQRAIEYKERYNAMKASLMMTSEYIVPAAAGESGGGNG